MKIQASIEESLRQSFSITYLHIINESDQHSGPPGRESHFHITLVSPDVENLSRIKRHQRVYQLLEKWMQSSVHALSLHIFTPEEWQARKQTSNASPNCSGKEKV